MRGRCSTLITALLTLLLLQHQLDSIAADAFTDSLCQLFKDGSKLRRPGTCNEYIACQDFVGEVRTCATAKLYERNAANCVDAKQLASDSYCENRCATKSNQGKWIADPTSCHGFYYCSGAVKVQGYCDEGQHFEEASQKCIFDQNSDCTGVPDICAVAPDKTKFRHEADCTGYYECTGGKRSKLITCKNTYFDVESGKCVDKSWITCTAHPLPKNICGTEKKPLRNVFKADTHTCRGFFYCEDYGLVPDLEPAWGQCPVGKFFSEPAKACVSPTDVVCPHNRCEGRGTMMVTTSNNNCHNYFVCKDSHVVEQRTCSNGGFFEEKLQACVKYPVYDKCCDNLDANGKPIK